MLEDIWGRIYFLMVSVMYFFLDYFNFDNCSLIGSASTTYITTQLTIFVALQMTLRRLWMDYTAQKVRHLYFLCHSI